MASDGFLVTIEGQPPSWNHMYKAIWQKTKTGKTFQRSAKTDVATKYQDDVRLIVQATRPSNFLPQGMVIVAYDWLLARDTDCDNLMKATNDAIARALGIDDKRFLPVGRSKELGMKRPMTHITILDATTWKIDLNRR